jgi:1,4-alpha-glucan branching enzyme
MSKSFFERFHSGYAMDAYKYFGAHFTTYYQKEGVMFRVYAPNALEVELIGDFNNWVGKDHKLKRLKSDPTVWQIFVKDLKEYTRYKYHIRTKDNRWIDKADPFAFFNERPPATASKVFNLDGFPWTDNEYMKNRTKNFNRVMNIYEVHLGSWKKKGNDYYSYEEIVNDLLNYVKANEFTHIELLPILEHPFDGSWGYQCTGYFAPTARYGNPKQLMHLIDRAHQEGIGVIIDFVPVHFVKDAHGLHLFDGGCVYEYEDEMNRYSEWDSVNFNLHKEEVRSFLISSVNYWIEYFHVDGIRFDAVSNIIYYKGRKDYGINEGALDYIKRSNYLIAKTHPSVMLIAEDSSDYQGVTKPTFEGGLGFDYKWDLGWMNDTLRYYSLDPVYRKYKHHQITFSMHYFYNERFLLPLSHDEVVHLKGSMINKMWGNYDEKFAQVRNLYAYMYFHPGKKLLFMGNEFGMMDEWQETKEISWNLYNFDSHVKLNRLIIDLNRITKFMSVLHNNDYDPSKFYWLMPNNIDQSIYAFVRFNDDELVIAIINMTPVGYNNYELGVPNLATYEEIINTDRVVYGGSDLVNYQPLTSLRSNIHNQPYSIKLNIGPFASILLKEIR